MRTTQPSESGSVLTEFRPQPKRERYELHAGLFVVTFISTVYAGGLLVGRGVVYEELGWTAYAMDGMRYAVAFLLFLTVHEFGHYIAARKHGISVSLPYFIPIPLIGVPVFHFGTFGAVIRIREPLRRTRQLFDVGAAGPLAGFVVALGVLILSIVTLPGASYLLDVPGHEAVASFVERNGVFPEVDFQPGDLILLFGDTPIFALVRQLVPGLPSPSELMHYPLLLAAWLGLFFTALNLLPVGQLDGGHVVYALFGAKAHAVIARMVTLVLLISGAIGFGHAFGTVWYGWVVLAGILGGLMWRLFEGDWRLLLPSLAGLMGLAALVVNFLPRLADSFGYSAWLLWVGLIVFLIRVDHPPVLVHEPLTPGRKLLGYLCLALFILCFSIQPIYIAG